MRVGDTTHEGDVVVVAAGAWADRLVPGLRGVGVPSRQAVLYLSPPPDLAQAWAEAPVMLDLQAEGGLYTLPAARRGTRLKIGDHVFSRTGNPDEDRVATAHDLERLWPAARATYRDLDRYAVLEPKACFYTVTEDEGFLVHPTGAAGWLGQRLLGARLQARFLDRGLGRACYHGGNARRRGHRTRGRADHHAALAPIDRGLTHRCLTIAA